MTSAEKTWARESFGEANLGNIARRRRLVAMATRVAESPAGPVSRVFADAAEREGAFRFLSSEKVPARAVSDALSASTLRACRGQVYCPVDGSSLSLTDNLCSRDVGGVGAWSYGGRGLNALTALAVDAAGAPVGVMGVEFWARKTPSTHRKKTPKDSLKSEVGRFVAFIEHLDEQHREHAPDLDVWYLFDRGFDAWPVWQKVRERGLTVTIRSSNERCLATEKGRPRRYLRKIVRRAPIRGSYSVDVPARPSRRARRATLDIRVASVDLLLQVSRKRTEIITVNAVLAKETNYQGKDRLEWLLLTTAPTHTLAEAEQVIASYSYRWRIEDLHRAWKNGMCCVEQTQLRNRTAIVKWSTIHLAVAARATRLTHLARTTPEVRASTEFSREEIDAVLLLKRKRAKHKMGEDPPLGDIVRLIADLGGYTGKSSGGPPGATVIGRGLEKVLVLAEGLRALKET